MLIELKLLLSYSIFLKFIFWLFGYPA